MELTKYTSYSSNTRDEYPTKWGRTVTAQMMPQGTLLLRNQATKEITQYNHEPESILEDS